MEFFQKIKEWILAHRASSSFIGFFMSGMMGGSLSNSASALSTLFILGSMVLMFMWFFYTVKYLYQSLFGGKTIAKTFSLEEGDTEIDKFLSKIQELNIADIYDNDAANKELKKLEQSISTDIPDGDKKRLIKKSIHFLQIWTEKASEDFLVTEGELQVWLWIYKLISTLTNELSENISKSEGKNLSDMLKSVQKYNAIYMLSIKWEYPECELDIVLKSWETWLYEQDATVMKSKTIREMHWYSGFSTSIRIAKWFSYRVGTVKPITSSRTVQYADDHGKFVITSERIWFVWAKQNFLIPLAKIIQFNASNEGLFLMKENTTKLYHLQLQDYDVPLLILQNLYSKMKEGNKETSVKQLTSASNSSNYMEELEKLAQLKDAGVITEKEFSEKKKKLLWI